MLAPARPLLGNRVGFSYVLKEKDAQIKTHRSELDTLKDRVASLEKLLTDFAEKKQVSPRRALIE